MQMKTRNANSLGMSGMNSGFNIMGRKGTTQSQPKPRGMFDLLNIRKQQPVQTQTNKGQVARPATPVPAMQASSPQEQAPAAPLEAASQEATTPIADTYAQAAKSFYFNPRRSNAQKVVA
jgi:hypothetical protein